MLDGGRVRSTPGRVADRFKNWWSEKAEKQEEKSHASTAFIGLLLPLVLLQRFSPIYERKAHSSVVRGRSRLLAEWL